MHFIGDFSIKIFFFFFLKERVTDSEREAKREKGREGQSGRGGFPEGRINGRF